MYHLIHVARIALIALMGMVVVADFYLQPTIVGLSRLMQCSLVVSDMSFASRALTAREFTRSILPGPYRNSDYHPVDIIDLNCTRLC